MSAKKRIDVLMVERGLTTSRSMAQRLIMAGQVRLDGQLIYKASETVNPDGDIKVVSLPKFVSRGGDKLAEALAAFKIEPIGWTCADVGASTGGFTDCLLQAGAKKVYAIDVGKGQLHYRLQKDRRVISLESINVRYLDELPELVDLVVVDVSFISLGYVIPVVRNWLQSQGSIIALIKPQFEAGKDQVGKGGVVRDPAVHIQVLRQVFESVAQHDLTLAGLIRSPLKGPKGNIEFLTLINKTSLSLDLEKLISSVIPTQEEENSN